MSRIEDVKNIYPITFDLALQIDKSKDHKYLRWVASALVTNDKDVVTKALNIFENYKHCFKSKDLYKHTVDQILSTELTESKSKNRSSFKKEGSLLLYEDETCSVIRILTFEAAQFYCRGTKWCISNDGTFSEYIYQHNNQIYLFVVDGKKYCMCVDREGCSDNDCYVYNEKDDALSYFGVKNSWKLLKAIEEDQFKTEFQKYCEMKSIPADQLLMTLDDVIINNVDYGNVDFSKLDKLEDFVLDKSNRKKLCDIIEESNYEIYDYILDYVEKDKNKNLISALLEEEVISASDFRIYDLLPDDHPLKITKEQKQKEAKAKKDLLAKKKKSLIKLLKEQNISIDELKEMNL